MSAGELVSVVLTFRSCGVPWRAGWTGETQDASLQQQSLHGQPLRAVILQHCDLPTGA